MIVLLLRLGLVGFNRINRVSRVRVMVSVRIKVRFNFSERVAIEFPDVEGMEFCRVLDL